MAQVNREVEQEHEVLKIYGGSLRGLKKKKRKMEETTTPRETVTRKQRRRLCRQPVVVVVVVAFCSVLFTIHMQQRVVTLCLSLTTEIEVLRWTFIR